jgi:maleate isomerase
MTTTATAHLQPEGRRHLLGVLTPSSNTVLEPATSAILGHVPGASAHFARFRVTQIGLGERARAQFDMAPMLAAAHLLADARVGVIGWSGTAASWLGFDRDEALCEAISASTGIRACTSVLALNELLARHPGRRFALVSPYTGDVQREIVANFNRAGYHVVAEAHLGISDNFAFSEVGEDEILDLCRRVAGARPEAIVIMCTNMRGAGLADRVERELGIPLYDSTSAVVWKALRLLGVDAAGVTGWGSLFAA